MTPKEIKTLGHAFFDGKTLQFRPWEVDRRDGKAWVDWPEKYCPDFDMHPEWRIKPDEPKKVRYCCYEKLNGELQWFRENTLIGFKHITELDHEITLPGGE